MLEQTEHGTRKKKDRLEPMDHGRNNPHVTQEACSRSRPGCCFVDWQMAIMACTSSTRGRRGIGTTMHGYRMRSISSQPSSIIIGCSRTCLVGAGDHTPDRDHSPCISPHPLLARPPGLALWFLKLCLSRSGRCCICTKVVQSPKSWTCKQGNRPASTCA